MKPQGVSIKQIKLRAFLFSLDDTAKEWLFYLCPRSITTWAKMIKAFLDCFFPASRVADNRKEICGISKRFQELTRLLERFNRLCTSCPQHDISYQCLIDHFYEWLLLLERRMLDVASGGTIINKTPWQVRELILIMVATSQQFGSTRDTLWRVSEVNIFFLESQIS